MDTDNFKNRLYLLTVIGKDLANTLEDLNRLQETFFKEYKEDMVQYGNSIYFSSPKETKEIGEELNVLMKSDFGYVLIDITDNLNKYDFKGNITKSHTSSSKFTKLIEKFLHTEDDVEEKENVIELSLDEKLKIAIEEEDYEKAAEIRDEIREKSEFSEKM